jgi:hypothetical protein
VLCVGWKYDHVVGKQIENEQPRQKK